MFEIFETLIFTIRLTNKFYSMKKLVLGFSAVFLGAILFVSCSNDEDENPVDQDFTPSQDYSLASDLFESTQSTADDAEQGGKNINGGRSGAPCATIDFDTTGPNDYHIIVDFGDSNCLGGDGKVRRGIFRVSYNGRYVDKGTKITHSFENYFVNNHQIKGTKEIENMGLDQNQDPYFVITVNGTIIKPNGTDSVIFNSNRIRTWIAGDSTVGVVPWFFDDVYQITGNGTGVVETGVASNGIPYEVVITKAVIVKFCILPFIVEGTIQLTPQGGSPRILDYGEGACDRKATVTFMGRTYNIFI